MLELPRAARSSAASGAPEPVHRAAHARAPSGLLPFRDRVGLGGMGVPVVPGRRLDQPGRRASLTSAHPVGDEGSGLCLCPTGQTTRRGGSPATSHNRLALTRRAEDVPALLGDVAEFGPSPGSWSAE
jgi:hypothetical protein